MRSRMINRRTFLAATSLAAGSAATLRLRGAAPGSRPNILIITTDQQFADSVSYRIGSQYIRTPHMDSLAANGVVFPRAYSANPLCVPSRTSMYTGRYPTETGVMDNDDRTKVRPDPRKLPLMGTTFQNAGYKTGYFGKWHLPYPENDTSVHGFSELDSRQDDPVQASQTAKFLRTRHDQPFLVVASLLNPHNIAEWSRGQRLPLGEVGSPPPLDQCPPQRPNYKPPKGEPDIVTLMRRSYQSAPMFPVGGFDEKKWREYIWAYYRLIEKVDAQIGVVLEALRDSGQEQNTLVVFTADHGECMGSHGWNQKTVLYEEATRVPLIISHKGAIKPGVSNHLVNTGIDLIPTLCDFAGIAVPENLPGLSMKAATNTKNAPDRRKYIVVSNRMIQGVAVDGRVPTTTGRMIRSQRHKYAAYSEGQEREFLVDLEKDPGEMSNRAGDPKFARVLNEHRAMLAEWCRQTNDSFPVPRGG